MYNTCVPILLTSVTRRWVECVLKHAYGTYVSLYYSIITLSNYHIIILSSYHGIMIPSYHRIIVSLYHRIIVSSYHCTIILLCKPCVSPHGHHIIISLYYISDWHMLTGTIIQQYTGRCSIGGTKVNFICEYDDGPAEQALTKAEYTICADGPYNSWLLLQDADDANPVLRINPTMPCVHAKQPQPHTASSVC